MLRLQVIPRQVSHGYSGTAVKSPDGSYTVTSIKYIGSEGVLVSLPPNVVFESWVAAPDAYEKVSAMAARLWK